MTENITLNEIVIKSLKKILGLIRRTSMEAFIWLAGLGYLLSIDPYAVKHYDLCVFKLMGFDWCPGCGLGRSVALVFHGDISGSFISHPLGIPALIILSHRIISLLYKSYNSAYYLEEVQNG